jgi:outer membrane protein assembly factor BamB
MASIGDAAVYKVDYRNGKVLWKYQFKLKHGSSFGRYALPNFFQVQNGRVFVASQDSVVYALNATTGHLIWSYVFDQMSSSRSPVVLDHGTFSTTVSQEIPGTKFTQFVLYMFDTQTGKLLLTHRSVEYFTIRDQVLYSTAGEGNPFEAFDLKSNKLLWQTSIPGHVFLTPHVIAGKVSVVVTREPSDTPESFIYAFDAASGRQLWHSQAMTTGPVNDLTVGDTTIFCGETTGSVYAYDAASGHLRWSRAVHFVGSLAVEANIVYATFNPSNVNPADGGPPVPGVVSLDARTGSLIWQKIITTPNADDPYTDSIIGILAYDKNLYISRRKSAQPPKGGTAEQTMDLDGSQKLRWQIELGGYSDVLIP